jgi:hypothetical protein
MHSNSNTIGDITFYVIISLSLLGTIISLFLCEPKALKRSDGSPVSLPQIPTWKSEMLDLFETPKQDVYIVLFFPMFFCLEFLLPLSVQHVQSRSVQYPHTLLEQHNVLACRNRGLVPCRIYFGLKPHTALSVGVHCGWDAVCPGVCRLDWCVRVATQGILDDGERCHQERFYRFGLRRAIAALPFF